MAELTQGERLQPSLLDRLIDDFPEKSKRVEVDPKPQDESASGVEESERQSRLAQRERKLREQSANQVINSRQLREFVKRDLAWLLNSKCLEDTTDLSAFPNVENSVLNYGMSDLTGMVVSGAETQAIEKKLISVITQFEPRIIKRSLRVKVSKSDEMSRNALHFEIECDVWGQPVPERMYLQSQIDLEDGAFKLWE